MANSIPAVSTSASPATASSTSFSTTSSSPRQQLLQQTQALAALMARIDAQASAIAGAQSGGNQQVAANLQAAVPHVQTAAREIDQVTATIQSQEAKNDEKAGPPPQAGSATAAPASTPAAASFPTFEQFIEMPKHAALKQYCTPEQQRIAYNTFVATQSVLGSLNRANSLVTGDLVVHGLTITPRDF